MTIFYKYTLIIIALAFFIPNELTAQDDNVDEYYNEYEIPKVIFQLRGGMNLSNVIGQQNDTQYKGEMIVGYNVGAMVDFSISRSKEYYIRTGLQLTTKGCIIEDMPIYGGGSAEATMRANYIQIPLHFVFRSNITQDRKSVFGLSGGLYFAYGIGGTTSLSRYSGSDVDTFQDNGLWNRPDIGVGLEIFVEYNKFVVAIGSEVGMSNTWKQEYLIRGLNARNQNAYLSLGYIF